MNVAYFTNNYNPIKSGISASIASYCMALEDLGHNVYIFAPFFPGYEDLATNVIRTASLDVYYKVKYPLSYVSPRALERHLCHLGIDLIHSHHPFGIGHAGQKASHNLNIPVIFTYHTRFEYYTHYIPLPNFQILKNIVKSKAISYSNRCDLVIAPTKTISSILIGSGCKAPIKVLPSGISRCLEEYNDLAEIKNLKRRYQPNDEGPICLVVTRLAEEKNIPFLLRAFSYVVNRIPNAVLVIVGGGHAFGRITKLISKLRLVNNVNLVGHVEHREVSKYYAMADLYLHSSVTETQGMPLLESNLFGLPVIAVYSAVTKEILKSLKNGVIVPADEQIFADCIVRFSENLEKVKTKFANCPKRLIPYGSQVLGKKLETIYKIILCQHPANWRSPDGY